MTPLNSAPTNQQRLRETMAAIFAISPTVIDDTTSPAVVPAWDSLGHLNLVMAVEEQFGVELSAHDTLAMRDVRGIRSVLARHGIDC